MSKLEKHFSSFRNNTVGIDQITFGIELNKVEVIEFKHLKSFDIPEYAR